MNDKLIEKLEVLAGTRAGPGGASGAAVRLSDLSGLLALPPTLKSAHAAGAAPTAAEFDALVDDVQALHLRLLAVAEALQGRLRR